MGLLFPFYRRENRGPESHRETNAVAAPGRLATQHSCERPKPRQDGKETEPARGPRPTTAPLTPRLATPAPATERPCPRRNRSPSPRTRESPANPRAAPSGQSALSARARTTLSPRQVLPGASGLRPVLEREGKCGLDHSKKRSWSPNLLSFPSHRRPAPSFSAPKPGAWKWSPRRRKTRAPSAERRIQTRGGAPAARAPAPRPSAEQAGGAGAALQPAPSAGGVDSVSFLVPPWGRRCETVALDPQRDLVKTTPGGSEA